MIPVRWDEAACLVRLHKATKRAEPARELVAEGTLLEVCQALLPLPAARWHELFIFFPDRKILPHSYEHSDFYLLLLKAGFETARYPRPKIKT